MQENMNITREDQRDEAEGQRLPGLEGDESQRQRNQDCGLELQTQQEGQDDLLDETVLWKNNQNIRRNNDNESLNYVGMIEMHKTQKNWEEGEIIIR